LLNVKYPECDNGMMIKNPKHRKLCLFLFILLIFALIMPEFASAYDGNGYGYHRHTTLEPGEYKAYNAAGYYGGYAMKGNKIKAEITVLSGGNIDVYLLDEDQYEDYLEDANNTNTSKAFTYIEKGSKQNTKQFSYTYDVKYDGQYYIVIDNRNNFQPDDALPTGNVSVEVKYSEIWAGYGGLFYPEIPVEGILICATTFIILIVIIIAAVIVLTKKGKKNIPPPPMPPNYYPPQP
jgi:MoaA/NifB/PqqE/SkfB family radical SAM enzyme